MAGETEQLKEQVTSLYGKFSKKQRVMFGIALAGVMGAFGFMIASGTSEDLRPLFTNLEEQDAASIVEALDDMKIEYRIGVGGSAILVPVEKVHELRLQLASRGLPRGGGVGFEIFDQKTFGMSEFAQKLNYRRALMGELSRTITRIDVVESARVHIVQPERTLFSEDQQRPRASVTLRMIKGRRLGEGQVDAIVHLLSSSVADLDTESVTVVDTKGRILSKAGDGAGAMKSFEHARKVEQSLETRVKSIVEKAVGKDRVEVQVTADVDLSQIERTAETFDPEMTAVRSEQASEEKTSSGGGQVGGPVGVTPTLANAPSESARSKDGSSRKSELRNYEVSKTTQREIVPSGKINRLSVAVLVDSGAGAAAGSEAVEVNPQLIASLERVVKRAVGFNAERGDTVDIEAVPFAPPEEIAAAAPPSFVSRAAPMAPYAVALAGLAVLLALVLTLRKRVKAEPVIATLPRTVRELEAQMQGARGDPSQLPDGQKAVGLLAARSAEDDNVRAAAVLRSWLAQG